MEKPVAGSLFPFYERGNTEVFKADRKKAVWN